MIKFIRSKKWEIISIFASVVMLILGSLIENKTVSLIFFTVGYGISGWKVIYKAIRGIIGGQIFDENLLMTLATVGAIAIGEYSESILVMTLYRFGELFEKGAIAKSREAITSLMDMCPETVNLVKGTEIVLSDPYDVEVGDLILVKAGEKVALDGIVESGASYLNVSALTGESVPVSVSEGDRVMSGSINERGALYIRVASRAEDSTVSKILELIDNSADKKSRCESFITKFAKYYTPCVVLGAILVAVLPPLLFSASWASQIRSAMVFLMISCPCALVISVPLTFFGGIGRASKMGILIKGSDSLENLAKIKTVAFDKTGTLTCGKFKVSNVISDLPDDELLYYAAYAEALSDHPIATSLKDAYRGEIDIQKVTSFSEIAGMGVIAQLDGDRVAVGNARLAEYLGVEADLANSEFGSMAHVFKNSSYIGSVEISDTIKSGSLEAIDRLRSRGINTVMLSGDKNSVCKYVSEQLSISEYYGELMPDEKLKVAKEIAKKTSDEGLLCFVGDGINDAPVLALSDISVAMGGLGSDAAVEASDIVLIDDDPSQIADAIELSLKVNSIARQNIVFSLAVKFAVMILGVFGIAGIWEAIFADVGVSVIAILNATRTMIWKK